MLNDNSENTNTEGTEGTEGSGSTSKASKKGMDPIIMAVAGAVIGIVVIIALIMFTPLKKLIVGEPPAAAEGASAHEEAKVVSKDIETDMKTVAFLPLPEVLVNLKNTGKGRGNILKAIFVLELTDEKAREHVTQFIPLIMDQFQTFLREMEIGDLQGAAGIEKTRQELESRVNQVITPIKIRSILVKDFLVQ